MTAALSKGVKQAARRHPIGQSGEISPGTGKEGGKVRPAVESPWCVVTASGLREGAGPANFRHMNRRSSSGVEARSTEPDQLAARRKREGIPCPTSTPQVGVRPLFGEREK